MRLYGSQFVEQRFHRICDRRGRPGALFGKGASCFVSGLAGSPDSELHLEIVQHHGRTFWYCLRRTAVNFVGRRLVERFAPRLGLIPALDPFPPALVGFLASFTNFSFLPY